MKRKERLAASRTMAVWCAESTVTDTDVHTARSEARVGYWRGRGAKIPDMVALLNGSRKKCEPPLLPWLIGHPPVLGTSPGLAAAR